MCLNRLDQMTHQMLLCPKGQALDTPNEVGGHNLADRDNAANETGPANDEVTHLPTAI